MNIQQLMEAVSALQAHDALAFAVAAGFRGGLGSSPSSSPKNSTATAAASRRSPAPASSCHTDGYGSDTETIDSTSPFDDRIGT